MQTRALPVLTNFLYDIISRLPFGKDGCGRERMREIAVLIFERSQTSNLLEMTIKIRDVIEAALKANDFGRFLVLNESPTNV